MGAGAHSGGSKLAPGPKVCSSRWPAAWIKPQFDIGSNWNGRGRNSLKESKYLKGQSVGVNLPRAICSQPPKCVPYKAKRHRGTETYFGKENVNILENCHKCYSLSLGDGDEKCCLWWWQTGQWLIGWQRMRSSVKVPEANMNVLMSQLFGGTRTEMDGQYLWGPAELV